MEQNDHPSGSRLRSSMEQMETLVAFMETNHDLARPLACAQGKETATRLWQELTLLLNSLGGGVQRSKKKWQKVWADLKTKTKKKGYEIKRHVGGTGGGPPSRQTLTSLEERVLAIMGPTAVVGLAQIEEQGLGTAQTSTNENIVPNPDVPENFSFELSPPDQNEHPLSPAIPVSRARHLPVAPTFPSRPSPTPTIEVPILPSRPPLTPAPVAPTLQSRPPPRPTSVAPTLQSRPPPRPTSVAPTFPSRPSPTPTIEVPILPSRPPLTPAPVAPTLQSRPPPRPTSVAPILPFRPSPTASPLASPPPTSSQRPRREVLSPVFRLLPAPPPPAA